MNLGWQLIPSPTRLPAQPAQARSMKSIITRSSPSRRRFWLAYPPEKVVEPLLWEMSQQNEVVFNLRSVSANDRGGLIGLELEGMAAAVDGTVRWFRRHGVEAYPIELSALEG